MPWLEVAATGHSISSELVTFQGTTFNPLSGLHEANVRLIAADFHGAKAYKWLVINVLPAAPSVLASLPNQEVYINETISFSLPALATLFRGNDPVPGLSFEVTYVHDGNGTAAMPAMLPPWVAYNNETRIISGLRSALPVSPPVPRPALSSPRC